MKASNTETVRDPVGVTIARLLLFSTVAVPLIILLNSFFPYVTPRSLYFRVVVEVTLGIFAYLLISREWKAQVRFDPFLFGLAAFVLAGALSALFSPARNRAIFGDFERMGGVWAMLHYLIFYAMLRVFFGPRQWKIFLRLIAGATTLVALIAVREGPGSRGAESTVGNPGLLGLYLFFGVCICVFLATRASSRKISAVYALGAIVNFSGLIVSQNRSSVLALIVAMGVATVIYLMRGSTHRGWILGMAVVLLLGFTGAMTVVIRAPESWAAKQLPTTLSRIRDSGIQKNDAGRIVFWRAAYEGFKERPILGYGPENFHLAWSANFQPKVYTVTREERVDRAHNIVLEVLSTTGVVGFAAFMAMWLAIFASIAAGLRSNGLQLSNAIFFAATSAGYLVALGFWFIDINSFMVWLAICAFLAHERLRGPAIEFGGVQAIDPARKLIFVATVLALLSSLWLHGFETFRVARLLYQTQVEARNDMPTTLHRYFAIFDSPVPQTSHSPMLFGRYMGSIIPNLKRAELDSSTRLLIDTAFARGLVETDRERKRDPRNELVYLQQSRLALLASSYYGVPAYYEYALKTMREAVNLSPNRVPPKLVLAYTFMLGGRFPEAHTQLMDAKAIFPSGQVYYYFGEFYRLQNQLPQAVAALDTSLLYGYKGPPSVYTTVIDSLQRRGQYADAVRIAESYLILLQPDFRSTLPRTKPVDYPQVVLPLLARLPWLSAMAGDSGRAVAAAQSLKALFPPTLEIADEFIRQLNSGESQWRQDTTLLRRAPKEFSG